MYKISVIVPVFNSENYLRKAIDSLINQTISDIEIILIDDGSTDKSGIICDEYLVYENVKVLHKVNAGICEARNDGLKIATGEYVAFMDNDDFLIPQTFEDNLQLIEKYNADWIKYGKTEILIKDGQELKKKATNFKSQIYNHDEIIDNLFCLKAEDCLTFVWDSIFKMDIIKKNHLKFDSNFKLGNEDIDFCEQYALLSNKLFVNKKCYYVHYTRIGISASSKFSKEKIESYIYLLFKENNRYKKNNLIEKNTKLYEYIVTKHIVFNICSKINESKCFTYKEKKKWLRNISCRSEFDIYNSNKKSQLFNISKKMFIYSFLFKKKAFGLILLIDKYSKMLIYIWRGLVN